MQNKLKGWGHNQIKSNFGLFFNFCTDLPNFWHVSYKLIGKHFCIYFFWCFCCCRCCFQDITYAKQKKNERAAKETKDLQRKLLGKLIFLHALFFEKEEKTSGKKKQRNIFLSICSSHAKNYANLSKNKKQHKIWHRQVMPPALQLKGCME